MYGYDTTLSASNSFQSIAHIALSFINHLHSSLWTTPTPRPILLLSHSLGGVILKEVVITMAEMSAPKLDLFKGGIFFGVPSEGMEISHLLAMVKGQPNKDLVECLSPASPYLRELNDRFSGILSSRPATYIYAFETKTSPTVEVRPLQLHNLYFLRSTSYQNSIPATAGWRHLWPHRASGHTGQS